MAKAPTSPPGGAFSAEDEPLPGLLAEVNPVQANAGVGKPGASGASRRRRRASNAPGGVAGDATGSVADNFAPPSPTDAASGLAAKAALGAASGGVGPMLSAGKSMAKSASQGRAQSQPRALGSGGGHAAKDPLKRAGAGAGAGFGGMFGGGKKRGKGKQHAGALFGAVQGLKKKLKRKAKWGAIGYMGFLMLLMVIIVAPLVIVMQVVLGNPFTKFIAGGVCTADDALSTFSFGLIHESKYCIAYDALEKALGGAAVNQLKSQLGVTLRAELDCTNVTPAARVAGDCIPGLLSTPEDQAQATPIPPRAQWLIPVYQAASAKYGVPWELIAAVNATRTNFGEYDCPSTAANMGAGFLRQPATGGYIKYSTNGGQATDSAQNAGACFTSGPPYKTASPVKDTGGNPYDAVDAVYIEARMLAAHGATGNAWDYNGTNIATLVPGAGSTTDTGAGATGSLGANASAVFNYFTGKGLTPAQAAGIVGNFQQESGIDPADPGGYLAQWGGNRLAALQALASSRKVSVTDLNLQLDFVWQELNGGFANILAKLKATSTAADAATVFSGSTNAGYPPGYESPGTPMMQNRIKYANDALAQFGPGGSSSVFGPLPSGGTGGTTPLGKAGGTSTGKAGQTTVISALISAATTINNKDYPYVWGGGHAQAGTADAGVGGGSIGFDCSGSVAAVLSAAHLWAPGGSVPRDDAVIQALLSKGVIAPGAGSGAQEVTLYDNPGIHIFMRINGQYWGTSDGENGNHSQPHGGAGWLHDSHPDASSAAFKQYHVLPNLLNNQTTYALSGAVVGASGGPAAAGGGVTVNLPSGTPFSDGSVFYPPLPPAGASPDGGATASGPIAGLRNIVPVILPIAAKYNVPPLMMLATMYIETGFTGRDSPGNLTHTGWFQAQNKETGGSPPYAYGIWSHTVPTTAETHDLGLSATAFAQAAAGWAAGDASLRSNIQMWAMKTQGVNSSNNPYYITGWPTAISTSQSALNQFGGSTGGTAGTGTAPGSTGTGPGSTGTGPGGTTGSTGPPLSTAKPCPLKAATDKFSTAVAYDGPYHLMSPCYVALVNAWYQDIVANPSNGGASSSVDGGSIVQIAEAELAKGIKEIPDGSNQGPGIQKYWYFDPSGYTAGWPWCAAFASWVWHTAGVPNFPGTASAAGFQDWATHHNLFHPVGSGYVPRPGDVAVHGTAHVDIVEKVLANGQIITIGGNWGNAVARVGPEPQTADGITGFASPGVYASSTGTTGATGGTGSPKLPPPSNKPKSTH